MLALFFSPDMGDYRSRKRLMNEYLGKKIGFDTDENGPSNDWVTYLPTLEPPCIKETTMRTAGSPPLLPENVCLGPKPTASGRHRRVPNNKIIGVPKGGDLRWRKYNRKRAL